MTDELATQSGWAIFMGVVMAAIGIFMIAYPLATAAATTVLIGWSLIFAAVALFVFALNSQSFGNFALKVLLSIAFGICGITLAFFPLAGVVTLTGALATFLLIEAGLEMAIGFQLKPLSGWGWFIFDGVASLLLAILILAGWPSSSSWAIGTLVGVSVLMNGITRVIVGATIRSEVSHLEHMAKGTA